MSFKTLPESLVSSVSEVLSKSIQDDFQLINKIVEEGLSQFGVSSTEELSEQQKKEFFSWTKKKLQSEKDAKLLGECDCESGIEQTEEEEKASDLAKTAFHNSWKEDTTTNTTEDCGKEHKDITENIAIAPDQLASNGAVGVRDSAQRTPVHADVLRDTSVVENKTEYRMLVQFPTNERSTIVPPVTLPGAPSVSALREIVEGLPYFCECMQKALENAQDVPHNQPAFRGDSTVEKE